jgi:hypothetical protein
MSKLPSSHSASITLNTKGDEMPEASRQDAPLRDPQYPQGAEREDLSSQAEYQQPRATETDLPSGDIYGQLPRSRAENFGRTVGSTMGGVLRFPQRIGQATSRIRHAGNSTRAQASAAVLDMMDTAAGRAENLRRTTSAKLSDWTRSARYRTERLEHQAAERWEEIRSSAKQRLDATGRRAAAQWNQTQRAVSRIQQEDPARFLMVVAGVAFVIGAGLRIWRSSHD